MLLAGLHPRGGNDPGGRLQIALKLPIAADMKSATFVYVDPGRHTDKEAPALGRGAPATLEPAPRTRNPARRSRGLRRRVRGSDRRLHDRSRPRPRAAGSRMTPNRSRSLSQSGSLQDPQDPLFRSPRIHLSSFEGMRDLSLKRKAFLGLRPPESALRAHRPDRPGRSGRDVSDPAFRPPGAARKALPPTVEDLPPQEGRSRPE